MHSLFRMTHTIDDAQQDGSSSTTMKSRNMKRHENKREKTAETLVSKRKASTSLSASPLNVRACASASLKGSASARNPTDTSFA